MRLWLAKEGINGSYLIMRESTPPIWRLVSGLKGRKNTMTCTGYGNDLFWIRNIDFCFPKFKIDHYGQMLLNLEMHDSKYSLQACENNNNAIQKDVTSYFICKEKTFGMYYIIGSKLDAYDINVATPKYFITSQIENLFPTFRIADSHGAKEIELTPIENGYQIREVKNDSTKDR